LIQLSTTYQWYISKVISYYSLSHIILELSWTIYPIVMLMILVIQSISLIYHIELGTASTTSISIIGNQWYWIYDNLESRYVLESKYLS